MRRWLFLVFATAACSSTGDVRLAGQFTTEAPAPTEVRVMLDPHYGQKGELDPEEIARSDPYRSVFPDRNGAFSTETFAVDAGKRMKALPPPSFYLAFINEKDVLYAVGQLHSVLQYRAFDAATKAPLDRATTCWKIIRGTYEKADSTTTLRIVVSPNFDSPKDCLPPGVFTPGYLESEDDSEE